MQPASARSLWLERLLGAITIGGLLLVLELVVRTGGVNPALIPAPSQVLLQTWRIVMSASLFEPLRSTLYLLFAGYFLGSALAIALGLLMGRFQAAYHLFEPLVELLRPLPKPALLPPLILFLGLGDPMKLTVVGLGVFFPILINTIQGVRGTDPVQINVARTFGHSGARVLLKVILPSAMPMIFAGMRVGLGLGLILVVIAEMLAGTGGVGFLIIDMQRTFQVTRMYAWLLILAVLGFALNSLFVRLERRAIHWALPSAT